MATILRGWFKNIGSPLVPLEKGGITVKSLLLKGALGAIWDV